MKPNMFSLFSIMVISVTAIGCGTAEKCEPNKQEDCNCADGDTGIQRCLADGSGWTICSCEEGACQPNETAGCECASGGFGLKTCLTDGSGWDECICDGCNSVSWETSVVALQAGDFFIIADGEAFLANVTDIDVDSDPGDTERCTLELIWQEKSVEMRLLIYFQSDGTNWWSDEIRTYNGKEQGDWVYYYGRFFESSMGEPFIGDFEQENGNSKLYFQDLSIQAFIN